VCVVWGGVWCGGVWAVCGVRAGVAGVCVGGGGRCGRAWWPTQSHLGGGVNPVPSRRSVVWGGVGGELPVWWQVCVWEGWEMVNVWWQGRCVVCEGGVGKCGVGQVGWWGGGVCGCVWWCSVWGVCV